MDILEHSRVMADSLHVRIMTSSNVQGVSRVADFFYCES
jgi:hypothetical protein